MRDAAHRQESKPLKRKLSRAGRLLAPLLSATLLAACATGTTAISSSAICSGWKPITYSTTHDTPQTVAQIRAHNLFGVRRGCWKTGK
jgi:hypothetical protein